MIIATARLLLRDFAEDDWPAVLAYQSDPQYLRFYDWFSHTEEEVRSFVQRFIDWSQEHPRSKFQLAITMRGNGRVIGNCGIRMAKPEALEAEIGYELAPEYWGRGLASEAARAMVEFGFKDLKLHRVWARCVAENVASAHVLEKLGMRQEGRLRQHEWVKDRWMDTLLYGILEQEWQKEGVDGQER